MVRALLAVLVLAACGKPSEDHARALYVRVPVATAHGLSGLAADDTGGIWAVAERAERAYRIVLDDRLVPRIDTFTVEGVPPGTDLEGIAVLGGGRFAFGTEDHEGGVAKVLTAVRRDATLVVDGAIALPEALVGVRLAPNHGAEGVCGAGSTIVAAIEGVGLVGGRRWSPVVRIEGGAPVRTHRLWLTTSTGKLSALDCAIAADGAITVRAIERHFEVTRLLSFVLPPVGQGADVISPHVDLDLGPVLRGTLNLEGIAQVSDGRVVAVVDNQWKTITGPSELLVFATPAGPRGPGPRP